MTHELADMLRKNRTIDWQKKDSARAGMRKMIKHLLKKYDYPPEGGEDAVATILRNENFGRIAWRNNKAGGDKITARFYLFG